jgi:hypothetical protein
LISIKQKEVASKNKIKCDIKVSTFAQHKQIDLQKQTKWIGIGLQREKLFEFADILGLDESYPYCFKPLIICLQPSWTVSFGMFFYYFISAGHGSRALLLPPR